MKFEARDYWSLCSLVFIVSWAGFWCPFVSWISFALLFRQQERLYGLPILSLHVRSIHSPREKEHIASDSFSSNQSSSDIMISPCYALHRKNNLFSSFFICYLLEIDVRALGKAWKIYTEWNYTFIFLKCFHFLYYTNYIICSTSFVATHTYWMIER